MKNPIKDFIEDKKKDELGKDFQKILRYADRYFDNDNKIVKYHLSLHIFSKKNIDVDIEEIFKTIRARVIIDDGAIDYEEKGNIQDLCVSLNYPGWDYESDDKSIVFDPMYREHFEDEYRHQRNILERNAMSAIHVPIKVKKRNEFFPDHLFIYVVEKGKIYNGYEFVAGFLSEYRPKTFYYKGSIEYNFVQHLRVNKMEIM